MASATGMDFPLALSSAQGQFQCVGWDRHGGDDGYGARRYHDWMPVGYFNVPLLEGGHSTPNGNYVVGERADRQYVVRACRNCTAIWHQDVTEVTS